MSLPKIALPTFQIKNLPISKKTVEARPYLVKEDKSLLMAAQNMSVQGIALATKNIVKSCIIDSDFDVDNAASLDIDYIFMHLRAQSVGNVQDVEVTCNHLVDNEKCDKTFTAPVSITDLKLVEDEKNENMIMIDAKSGIKMKPTTFRATLEATDDEDEMITNINILYHSIEQIFVNDEVYTIKDFTKEEFGQWVEENLTVDKFSKMMDYINNLPRLELQKRVNCPKCKHVHELKFADSVNFF